MFRPGRVMGHVALCVVLALGACAQTDSEPAGDPPKPVSAWLDPDQTAQPEVAKPPPFRLPESGAIIGVVAAGPVPEPKFHEVRIDSGWLAGAAEGALVGAAGMAAAGPGHCHGEHCGVVVLLWLMLIGAGAVLGAGIGAVAAEPELVHVATVLAQLEGSAPLLQYWRSAPTIEVMARDRLADALRANTSHQIRILAGPVSEHGEDAVKDMDAVVELRITDVGLVGGDGEDPLVSPWLVASARAYRIGEPRGAGHPGGTVGGTVGGEWSYMGEMRNLSYWTADGMARFGPEFERVARGLAERMAGGLFPPERPAVQARIDSLAPAADRGDPEAQYELAVFYRMEGRAEAAWTSLCRAADQGHPQARILVAASFRDGREPVERDLVQASMWYGLAAHPGAETQRRKIEQQMSGEQIAEAARLSAAWRPGQCDP